MSAVARIRRPIGGGHFLFGMSHYPFVTLAVLVVAIALLVYLARRR